MKIFTRLFIRLILGLTLTQSSVPSFAADEAKGVEFFEKHVRPILVENCYECHSLQSKKQKGGLLLDHKQGLLKGGDSGPALVPGKPNDSLIIQAISYTQDHLKMPPDDKRLNPTQIKLLTQWVQMGAPDPRTETRAIPKESIDPQSHWAFQPIKAPSPPTTVRQDWGVNAVDQFILARLEKNQLSPSPKATPHTLLRRAYLDLTGLPPTPAQMKEFLADPSPQNYAKVVDQLLASRHYGERWGRYWLDIARYADTKGYVFTSERRYPFSYTYRDYVIRSLNEDLPFNQFLVEQIAADRLDLGDDKRPLAALGFLTLGRRFLLNPHDIIDDRIDVVTRGTMGLTVSCARCHDHKYDPIPTADYYSLYGIFASAHEPKTKPLLGDSALPEDYPEYIAEKQRRETQRSDYQSEQQEVIRRKVRSQVGDYLLVVHDAAPLKDDGAKENLVRSRKLDPTLAAKWLSSLTTWKEKGHALFSPWFALSALTPEEFKSKAKDSLANLAGTSSTPPNQVVLQRLRETELNSIEDAAKIYNELFAQFAKQRPDPGSAETKELAEFLHGNQPPLNLNGSEIARIFPVAVSEKLKDLQRKIDRLESTHSGVPPRAMALEDASTPHHPQVFIRGNASNKGKKVPRQFLGFLEGADRKPYSKSSGRLEMAQAIASPKNPLTARVIVNRIWARHFGKAFVKTQSDFGLRADPPTHPDLLDYLATRFMNEGWSFKKLHRLIMLSETYQQSSAFNVASDKLDPENRLVWRMNRQRLDFEAMRDSILKVSGKLDLKFGGRSVEITKPPYSPRRAIYGLIERQNLPDLFRTFDFASPDLTSPGRFTTTVPQQALFLLNSPFMIEQAKQLAAREEIAKNESIEDQVSRLYELAYQRTPSSEELEWATNFLEGKDETAGLTRLQQYAQILLVSNELFFTD